MVRSVVPLIGILLMLQRHISIADDPMNLTAIKTLTAMGILSDDDNLIDAALSELLDMPAEQRQELDPSNDVDYLLVHYNLGKVSFQQAD